MFSEPQSLVADATYSLPRTSQGVDTGVFKKDDGNVSLQISHSVTRKGNRKIHTIVAKQSKILADPYTTGLNKTVSQSVRLSIDVDPDGYSLVDQVKLIAGLCGWGTASTNANFVKLVGGES